MLYFFTGILLLIFGYLTYGRFIEKIIAPTNEPTPAITKHDGVDFVPLSHLKNMLIQLLNIAGVGPVIGVIIGIKFGEIVFLILPIGNIIAGATHDYLSGMMSLRRGGANLPILIKDNLGSNYFKFFSIFSIFLLLLVVAVFINIPSNLIASNFLQDASENLAKSSPSLEWLSNLNYFWICVGAIFCYYVIATLFPVDKIIGKIYPLFGAILLIGTFAIFVALCFALYENPAILSESEAFRASKWTGANNHPVIPLLFVTIACGIISGFHATQSPIIARTMISEHQGRSSFYGVMVIEGLIGMIWAAGGLAIYNLFPETFSENATSVLIKITHHFLGSWIGSITVLGVIILAITSGDTAMRAVRLSLAEILKVGQKSLLKRVLICIPLILATLLLLVWSNTSAESFAQLWNYFAWGNQVLATSTLLAGSVWLFKQAKNGWVAIIPGMFMCFIVLSYILWIPSSKGGVGLDLHIAYLLSALGTLIAGGFAIYKSKKL